VRAALGNMNVQVGLSWENMRREAYITGRRLGFRLDKPYGWGTALGFYKDIKKRVRGGVWVRFWAV
jgi:hypothetical protein